MTKLSSSRVGLRPKHKGGRPVGTFRPLLTDPQRHSIAAWLLLRRLLGPHIAARLAIVAIDETEPIEIGRIEGLLTMLSAEYTPSPNSDFDDRARALAAKAKRAASRATDAEFEWLIASTAYLRGLIGFVAAGNWTGVHVTYRLLLERGWGEVLARFTRRLHLADASKPIDQARLQAAGRRLLEACRPEIIPA